MSASPAAVGALTAVDLDAARYVREAERRRKLIARKDDVELEVGRLGARISWLVRKASRLPLGNGKTKALAEARELQQTAVALAAALSGQLILEPLPGGSRHRQRAVRLLHDLLALHGPARDT